MSELGYLRPVDRPASPGKVRYAVDVLQKSKNRTTDKVSRKTFATRSRQKRK
jgi:hypothetical protein